MVVSAWCRTGSTSCGAWRRLVHTDPDLVADPVGVYEVRPQRRRPLWSATCMRRDVTHNCRVVPVGGVVEARFTFQNDLARFQTGGRGMQRHRWNARLSQSATRAANG